MITFNGMYFAKNDKEFTDSLFDHSGTCFGYYHTSRNGVLLMTMQKQPIAFIRFGELNQNFIVTCTDTDHGIRYMYSTTTQTEKILKLQSLSHTAIRDLCSHVKQQINNQQLQQLLPAI